MMSLSTSLEENSRLDRFTGRFGRYTGDLDGLVLSGIPADYSGLPAGLADIPVGSSSFSTLKKWIPGVK